VTENLEPDNRLLLFDTEAIGAPREIATGFEVDAPAFRPSNPDEFLFRGSRDGKVGLYLMRLDGTGLQTLVQPFEIEDRGHFESPLRNSIWSPDGSQIAYHRYDDEAGVWALFVANADGSNARRVGYRPGDGGDLDPAWSPDGTRIAFLRWHEDPKQAQFRVVRLAEDAVTTLQPGWPHRGASIAWTPDGTKILTIPWVGYPKAYLMDPDGGPPIDLPWGSEGAPSSGVGSGAGGWIQRLAP